MNCEHAANLISARIDGELPADEAAALDAHLAGCAECRAVQEATELQDAALLRAFAPERSQAALLADRIERMLRAEQPGSSTLRHSHAAGGSLRPILFRWIGAAAAMAAGFAIAMVLLRHKEEPAPVVVKPPTQGTPAPSIVPVAHLSLATGSVFTCPSHSDTWQPLAPGEPVGAGDRLRTADAAKCEVRLPDGSLVRMNAASEACFMAPRTVQVAGGQVWSSVPPGAAPLQLAANHASTRPAVAHAPAGAQVDVACVSSDAAVVTVMRGTAKVDGSLAALVNAGEWLRVGPASLSTVCMPIADGPAATRWLDDLLLLKPADDPELQARTRELLAAIIREQSTAPATLPATKVGPTEAGLRARGGAWGASLAHAIRDASPPLNTDLRRIAARLLADVALHHEVPALIQVLEDPDAEVRQHAARALRRLTGEPHGDDAGSWQQWHRQHR